MSVQKNRSIVFAEDEYEFKLRRFWIEGKRKKLTVPEHLESIRKKNMIRRTFVGIGLGILDKKADMQLLIRNHDERKKRLMLFNKALSLSVFFFVVFFVIFSSGMLAGKKKRFIPSVDVPFEKSVAIKSFVSGFADEYVSKGVPGTIHYWEPGLPPQAAAISHFNLSRFTAIVAPRINKVWRYPSENRIYYVTCSGPGSESLLMRLRETGAGAYSILSIEKS